MIQRTTICLSIFWKQCLMVHTENVLHEVWNWFFKTISIFHCCHSMNCSQIKDHCQLEAHLHKYFHMINTSLKWYKRTIVCKSINYFLKFVYTYYLPLSPLTHCTLSFVYNMCSLQPFILLAVMYPSECDMCTREVNMAKQNVRSFYQNVVLLLLYVHKSLKLASIIQVLTYCSISCRISKISKSQQVF